jgi:hypothetical protein
VCQNKQCSFIQSARAYTVGDRNTETRHLTQPCLSDSYSMERLQIVSGLFIRRHREKCTVLCANYIRLQILHLTQADLMTGIMRIRPLRIMKMDRNIGYA